MRYILCILLGAGLGWAWGAWRSGGRRWLLSLALFDDLRGDDRRDDLLYQ